MPDVVTTLLLSVLDRETALHVRERFLPVSVNEADVATRAELAEALALALAAGLLKRVPHAAKYVEEEWGNGRRVLLDHGALRTFEVASPLPSGVEAFRRILLPLGYEEVGEYPLPRLNMTGRVFRQADAPEQLCQYFISELHVTKLPAEAQAAIERTVASSKDPLSARAHTLLQQLSLALDQAGELLGHLVGCFARHHADMRTDDYETLLACSTEAAWIATEGNAFNHATDRVDDVQALAEVLKSDGWPMKDAVEVSTSGRVRQTAFRADPVVRSFVSRSRTVEAREVPGSFFEFISRDAQEDGTLDLGFDTGNAQGIFTMTRPS